MLMSLRYMFKQFYNLLPPDKCITEYLDPRLSIEGTYSLHTFMLRYNIKSVLYSLTAT